MAPLVYGYWHLRGLAEHIVFLLHHAEADFEVKRYNIANEPPYKAEWLKEKYDKGLAFPNLPYLIDGDTRITQSLAIVRRLARKFNLAGKNEDEFTQIDLLEQEANDLEMNLIILSYSRSGGDFETNKVEYLNNLPEKLEQFAKYLGTRDWFVGDSVTYVDFVIYEALDHNRMFAIDIFDKFPTLKAFLKRVESLPNIKKYMESKEYQRWPIYAPFAHFGGKGELPQ